MKLYSYQYLTNNSHLLDYVLIIAGLLLGVGIIILGMKYAKDRSNLKYRNILIVMFAFAAMVICFAIGKFQNQESTRNDSGQIARIMRRVGKEQHIAINKIYTSSPTVSKSLVIKAKENFYQVDINSSTSVYSIKKVHPFATHIEYINHGGLNLNISHSQYWNIAGKLLIGFIMLVMQINLSGKGNLDPSNAVDQLQNYILGGIVGGTVFNLSISVLSFIIIILIWTIIIFTSKSLINQNDFFKNLMNGSPKVIMENGRINVDAALRSGVSADELVVKLNSSGVKDLQKVSKVTLEQNGDLEIDNYHDTTANLPVITDGNINQDVLKYVHKDKEWLRNLIKSKNHSVKDVYLGQIVNGNDLILTLYPKHETRIWKFTPNEIIHVKNVINDKEQK